MNKKELASRIWDLANNLRGQVSAATYKDYILGFLFYKYLSDKEEKNLKESLLFTDSDMKSVNENDERTKNYCRDNFGYFISYDNLFSTWVMPGHDFSIGDVTNALNAFERSISEAYKKVFKDIFSTLSSRIVDLGPNDADRTKKCKDIIKLIKSIPTDNKQGYDVLGFIYEYLLKNFAANAGKAGEFYTPYEASLIMSEIVAYNLKGREEISIYDPTSGSGSLLINIGKSVSKYLGDANKVKYYAQELIKDTYNLTRMNLIMRGVEPSNIVVHCGDSLERDWPYYEDGDADNTYNYLQVDACCSNPPYSQPWTPKSDPRFDGYGIAPKSRAEYAFLLHGLYHLKNDGIMTIVLPHGALFRGASEKVIRENLVKKHNIETIIGLPANMFYGTGIPTIIMVLKKNRISDDILFVDASGDFAKEGNKNKLRQRDVRKIVDAVIARKNIDGYARLVSFDEIQKNDFNLNISRYISPNKQRETYNLHSLVFGGTPANELSYLNEFWMHFPSLFSDLFSPIKDNYYALKVSDIKTAIESNEDVKKWIKANDDRFGYLGGYLESELLKDFNGINIETEESRIADKIRETIKKNDLINYYDCYEILDNSWQEIVLDLETIRDGGEQSIRETEDITVLKKSSKGSKQLEEKIIGIDGKIIPFALIQTEYFKSLLEQVRTLDDELQSLNGQKEELLDSIDENDKQELLKDDGSGEIVAKKLKSKISEIKSLIKKGLEIEDDSYESIILKIDDISSKISSIKKELKDKKESLIKKTEDKLASLTNDEIHHLLIKKWIYPIVVGIKGLSEKTIKNLQNKITDIKDKYQYTIVDLDKDIGVAEKQFVGLSDDLSGSQDDLEAIREINKLLFEQGGNN